MSGELNIGDYVDFKSAQNDWAIGRIIEKENDSVRIRLDGIASKENPVIKS